MDKYFYRVYFENGARGRFQNNIIFPPLCIGIVSRTFTDTETSELQLVVYIDNKSHSCIVHFYFGILSVSGFLTSVSFLVH